LVATVGGWQQAVAAELGSRFVFLADEIYLQAGSASAGRRVRRLPDRRGRDRARPTVRGRLRSRDRSPPSAGSPRWRRDRRDG
jgi:hypothetical protein